MNQTDISMMTTEQWRKEHFHSCNKLLKAFTDVSKKYHSGTTDVPLETAIAAKMAINKPID